MTLGIVHKHCESIQVRKTSNCSSDHNEWHAVQVNCRLRKDDVLDNIIISSIDGNKPYKKIAMYIRSTLLPTSDNIIPTLPPTSDIITPTLPPTSAINKRSDSWVSKPTQHQLQHQGAMS